MRPSFFLRRIGTVKTTDQYLWGPAVENAFGKPYRNELWSKENKNEWSKDISILHSKVDTHLKTECISRGFALNSSTGWIAMMSKTQIFVFKPFGSCSFKLISTYKFTTQQTLNDEDKLKARIRFINNNIYVWCHSKATVFHYKLSGDKIETIRRLKDNYFRDSNTVDITVSDKYLILLFDQWLGLYTLSPSLKWYHAVSYSETSDIQPYTIEMTHYDYKQNNNNEIIHNSCKNYAIINVEGYLIATHPTNPSFEYLHIASNVGKNSSFCVSKKYGVFYTSNNGTMLYQSAHLESKSVHKILEIVPDNCKIYSIKTDINGINLTQNITKICCIVYDESYGISGRLLLFCQTNDSIHKYVIHQMCCYNDFIYFIDSNTNNNSMDFYANPIIIYIYQMLYGNDIMQKLLCSKMESNEYKEKIQNKIQNDINKQILNDAKEFICWFKDIVKLPQYINILIDNGFDSLTIVKHLTMEHLKEMGINKMGHQIQIIKQIEKLKGENQNQNENENQNQNVKINRKRKRDNDDNKHNNDDKKRQKLNNSKPSVN